MPIEPCYHCREILSVLRRRGLCWRCYYTPEIRSRYPHKPRPTSHSKLAQVDIEAAKSAAGEPCNDPPGSEGKIAVLAARAAVGAELWHPQDQL